MDMLETNLSIEEHEETTSLLVGSYVDTPSGSVAQVKRVLFVPRKDKRKDRVEIPEEQLSVGIHFADTLSMRVIGWAHSHPHISVFPSHVDLRTQHQLQAFDSRFFGIIYSCFDKGNERNQVTCFQAVQTPEGISRSEIPLFIVPSGSLSPEVITDWTVNLPSVIHIEEKEALQKDDANHLTQSYRCGVYTSALANLMDKVCLPVAQLCEDRERRNQQELSQRNSG
ncbi:BRCA1 BRCA2-containing complex, subunit 3 [Quaeritorhiza haematococci]|nr:BRCA1 BRCA2-containing complex, subunit 3 [Quaeritorhiza haematococci]